MGTFFKMEVHILNW